MGFEDKNFFRKKLVIDSLNLTAGNASRDIPLIYDFVLKTKNLFPGICIISRNSANFKVNPTYKGQMERLRRSGVGIFHANRQ